MPSRFPGRSNPLTVALLAAVALLAGCGSKGGRPSVVATTTSAPTTVAATTTTTVLPPAPQSSPSAASGALIHAWERGDRVAAAGVATPSAINALFAQPYGGQVLNNRGCGSPGPNPVVCSWGPFGGAAATSPLYNITVLPTGANWYVSGVALG